MTDIPVKIQIPYDMDFVRKRCRNTETYRLWDEGIVVIREVSPDAAPPAYRVIDFDPLSEIARYGGSYDLLSFEGALWWPVMSTHSDVGRLHFERGAAEGDEGILLLLDASLRPGSAIALGADAFFEGKETRKRDYSKQKEAWLRAQEGASRTILCDGQIHVRGGPPIFYLVHKRVKGGYEVMVGEAGWQRKETRDCHIPGPTWQQRYGSACNALAFGIDEFDHEVRLQVDRGLSVFGTPWIKTLVPSHEPAQPALLSAEAMKEHFWFLARSSETFLNCLCSNLPAMAAALDPAGKLEEVPSIGLLEQLVASTDREILKDFSGLMRAAADTLRRLRAQGHAALSEADEAALASLGP